MSNPAFVHLHCHSHFTLLECPVTVKKLTAAAAAQGAPAIALTDRGNLFGALEFQKTCADLKKSDHLDLQAILGCQLNIAPLGMHERTRDMLQLVLLATSTQGYFNLAHLVSQAWLEGYYYEPRIDFALLAQYSQDLICLTGAGNYGFLNYHLLSGAREEAQRQAGKLQDLFGDRLYFELCDHGYEDSRNLRRAGTELAKSLNLPTVATNWVHYLNESDAFVHDVQLAVQKVTTIADTRRKRMPSNQFYLKSVQEMASLFAEQPQALHHTLEIAERCRSAKIPTGVYHLPTFTCPETVDLTGYRQRLSQEEWSLRYEVDTTGKARGLDGPTLANQARTDAYLAELCERGLRKRYGNGIGSEHRERLDFELSTIARMGFSAYFLIVADFINWAKDRGIPVGPGRGSAAGSLVAYTLGITDLCPLRYSLLFERFLNPGRISMPDIDVDFCKDRRSEVIDYVAGKYGREAVTQIMTLGTMKARMAIKDVARAYEWTPEDAQELANLVPEDPTGKHTIAVCLKKSKIKGGDFDPSEKMLARYEQDERTRQVLDTALALENLGRSLGVHACGIIIAPGPVHAYVPVCTVKGKPATQFNMSQCEDAGLLKMDFLGLKTMSILKKAADIVVSRGGAQIDWPSVALDDRPTFQLLGEGRTLGVFQCESTGFQELIQLLQPDRFEDLIALVALYRPGPLKAGMHISYCDRKHGREPVTYPHPTLESILSETYGLFIYQEQIMNISRELCGFSQAEADNLRKAMGKKQRDVLDKMKVKFIEGAFIRHNFDKTVCQKMWEEIEGFAEYCFNKSHSACYGLISYWTAWAKANHFAAFMTANLIYEMGSKEKMTQFTQELKTQGIPVLPPDINESGWEFTWTGAAVRFGFGGVKGVGQGAAEHLMAERVNGGAFTSLFALVERIDTRVCNKRVIEHLIKVGALDSLHHNRRAMVESLDRAFERGARLAKNRQQAQATLFGLFEEDSSFKEATQGLVTCEDWDADTRLSFEKQLTGYWMSGHPLHAHQERLAPHTTHRAQDLAALPRTPVVVAAVVVEKKEIKTRAGKMMAVLTVEDDEGRFEAVLFGGRQARSGQFEPGAYERLAHTVDAGSVVLLRGKVDTRKAQRRPSSQHQDDEIDPAASEDEEDSPPEQLPGLIVDDIIPAHQLDERLTESVELIIDLGREAGPAIRATESLLREHPGACPVHALVQTTDDVLLTLHFGRAWQIHPGQAVIEHLRNIWGKTRVRTRNKQLVDQSKQLVYSEDSSAPRWDL